MAKKMYCWRCRVELPMLDASEWERVGPVLTNRVQAIKDYREKTGASLEEAVKGAPWEALAVYREITGYAETNINALWHHRIELYGPPCHACSKPLRTPVAKRCVECGAIRSNKTIEPTR
jgi:hypothetical protein